MTRKRFVSMSAGKKRKNAKTKSHKGDSFSLAERNRKHAPSRCNHFKPPPLAVIVDSLYEILVIAIGAVLSGAEHWTEMEE